MQHKYRTMSDAFRQEILYRGVGSDVLRYDLDEPSEIKGFIVQSKKGQATRQILKQSQKEQYERLLADPPDDYVMMICAIPGILEARIAALRLFINCELRAKKELFPFGAPFWHHITESRYDKLRDNPKYQDKVGDFPMLVLDSLTQNSELKLEKVYDLVSNTSGVRIILGTGMNPLEMASRLSISPDKILYLGHEDFIEI